MKQIDIKEYETLLLNAEKIAQKHLANAKVKEKKESLEIILNAINHATTMADTIKSLIESEAQAKKEVEILTVTIENHAKIDVDKADAEKKSKGKTIKVISNRRLRINGGILEHKKIAEIPNNDAAKRCLRSGLITMI